MCSDDPLSPRKPKAKKAKSSKEGRNRDHARHFQQAMQTFLAQMANAGSVTPSSFGFGGAATRVSPSSPEPKVLQSWTWRGSRRR